MFTLNRYQSINILKSYGDLRGDQSKPQKEKIAKVMREFKEGKLKSSSGNKVTDRDQAIAIAMSEAGLSKGRLSNDQLRELVEEHERLINVLESKSNKDDKKEVKIQEKELKGYKEKLNKAFDVLANCK